MASSSATTVDAYMAELPDERRAVIATLRSCILDHLQPGFVETMNWGMISYEIPLATCPDTYNGKPLSMAALAAQKRHYAVYLMSVYAHSKYEKTLIDGYQAAGIKLDMGKCCVRFPDLDRVHLPTIAKVIQMTTVDALIAMHDAVHKSPKKRPRKSC